MKIWYRQHLAAICHAVRHMHGLPGSFMMNVLVIAIALMLPFAGLTLLQNLRPLSAQLSVEPEISVFLKIATPRRTALSLESSIRDILHQQLPDAGRASIHFVPREDALTDLKNTITIPDIADTLGHNPLPDAYMLMLPYMQHADTVDQIDTIAKQLQTLPEVEHVQLDTDWVKRLVLLLHLGQFMLLFFAITLALVAIAVIFNTVRLQVLTQREEIMIARLVGATDAFIHRPFYYTGMLLGLGAGAVALSVVALGLSPLNQFIAPLVRLYESDFQLRTLNWNITLTLLAGSAALGLTGAILSVRRHLSRLF